MNENYNSKLNKLLTTKNDEEQQLKSLLAKLDNLPIFEIFKKVSRFVLVNFTRRRWNHLKKLSSRPQPFVGVTSTLEKT